MSSPVHATQRGREGCARCSTLCARTAPQCKTCSVCVKLCFPMPARASSSASVGLAWHFQDAMLVKVLKQCGTPRSQIWDETKTGLVKVLKQCGTTRSQIWDETKNWSNQIGETEKARPKRLDRDRNWRRPEVRSRPWWFCARIPTSCVGRVLAPFSRKNGQSHSRTPLLLIYLRV